MVYSITARNAFLRCTNGSITYRSTPSACTEVGSVWPSLVLSREGGKRGRSIAQDGGTRLALAWILPLPAMARARPRGVHPSRFQTLIGRSCPVLPEVTSSLYILHVVSHSPDFPPFSLPPKPMRERASAFAESRYHQTPKREISSLLVSAALFIHFSRT